MLGVFIMKKCGCGGFGFLQGRHNNSRGSQWCLAPVLLAYSTCIGRFAVQTVAAGFPGEKLMAAPDAICSGAVFPGPMLKLADAGW